MPGAKLEGGDLSPINAFLDRLQAQLQEIPDEDRRLLVVIAGHNGAGKTTIYRERIGETLSAFLATHINPGRFRPLAHTFVSALRQTNCR